LAWPPRREEGATASGARAEPGKKPGDRAMASEMLLCAVRRPGGP
jgi:hypothetical protein